VAPNTDVITYSGYYIHNYCFYSKMENVVCLGELYSVLRIVVRNMIIPMYDLHVVADRWWNHGLEPLAARVILRISSKCVEVGCARWWM